MNANVGLALRICRIFLATLFVLLAIVVLFVHAVGRTARSKASRLYRDLAALQLDSPLKDAAPLLQTYQATKSDAKPPGFVATDVCMGQADELYTIHVAPLSLSSLQKVRWFYFMPTIHYWYLDVRIYAGNGKIVCLSQNLRFLPRLSGNDMTTQSQLSPVPRDNDDSFKGNYRAFSFEMKGGNSLHVDVLPGASAEQLRSAFEVNLDCFTSFWGCADPSQIMPLAWQLRPSH